VSITLDISREEVLQLAAQRLADDAAGEEYIGDRVQQLITKRVNDAVAQALEGKIEEVLSREMEHILRETITPINIWGERAGAPTTLRDALAERARVFWDVKVDKEGKPSDYHGRPRHEHLMARLLNEEFTKAIRDNATAMVAAFASAVKADSARITAEHIDKLIQVKPR
jgi:hypothetical protein